MEHPNNTAQGVAIWIATIFINGVALVSKTDISFVLSCTVSILAITYYIIQIRKNTKK